MGNLAGHLLESCERRMHMHIMQARQNCRAIEINHTGVVIDMRFDDIFIAEHDRHQKLPAYEWIVRQAREQGLAGATVLRALEGFASRNGAGEFVEDLARKMRGSYRDLRRAWALQREGRRMPTEYLRLIEPRSVFNQFRDRVAQRMGVTATELVGRSQARRVSQARKILAYLCVQEGLTRAELGRMLNGRSRAAISYSIKSLEREMAASPRVRQQVEGLL